MIKNFKENLVGAIQILINPSYLKSKVDAINTSIDVHTGFSIVGKSVFNELTKIQEKYPTDIGIKNKIEELSLYPIEDKEDLKELIVEKQKIIQLEEKYCKTCHAPHLIECSHTNIQKSQTL